ncbi:MAG: alpha-L-arabinofuranosidase C-terminal domain-containing protein [Armatimonadota bacterium]
MIQGVGSEAVLRVDAGKPGQPVNPLFYGIIFEDINHAADGGIYAELVRNRAFEDAVVPNGCTVTNGMLRTPSGWERSFDDSNPIPGWKLVQDGEGSMALDREVLLNSCRCRSLRLEVTSVKSGRVAISNEGFWGIPLKQGAKYLFSIYAKANDATAGSGLVVSLEGVADQIYAREEIHGLNDQWKRYSCTLTSNGMDGNARLVIAVTRTGVLWLSMVSLFPEDTWKGRTNGLRSDLMQRLTDLKPGFVRFPGGCIVEGVTLDSAFLWKNTIGPIEERKGYYNLWGYRATGGMGFHEYLQMCEDLHAEPIYCFNCGMSCQSRKGVVVPLEELDEWIQDALDAIEYANGPANSKWGAMRAAAGHPEPFNLQYLEIGNENFGPEYEERYRLFYDAIKKRYPEMNLIATNRLNGVQVDIVDDHFYNYPPCLIAGAGKYDRYDRNGPKVVVTEYAAPFDCGQGNLEAALAESALVIGMERNSDVVLMTSYAPLFANVNDKAWNPDSICFDNTSSYGTPSHHAQKMFANNLPDENLDMSLKCPGNTLSSMQCGGVGLSTSNTQAEFKELKVAQGDKILYETDFTDANKWMMTGQWSVADCTFRQAADGGDLRAILGVPAWSERLWSDYTLNLKARKLGGNNGFCVMFRVLEDDCWFRWNIGGWDNSFHAMEMRFGSEHSIVGEKVSGSIETSRWYDLRVDIVGNHIRCYLDGKLIHDLHADIIPSLIAVAGRSRNTGDIILKVVNTTDQAMETSVIIDGTQGISSRGIETVLTSPRRDDENSMAEPLKVSPKTRDIEGLGTRFTRVFDPHSVTVLRLQPES